MPKYFHREDGFPGTVLAPDRLNIHLNGAAQSTELVIFIHGFGGSAYGTWQEFPGLILDDPTLGVDVGVFDYVSGKRALTARFKKASISSVADDLAAEIAGLSYDHVSLVCHSMGGLVAKLALSRIHNRQDRLEVMARVRCLVLLASPGHGVALASIEKVISSESLRLLNPAATDLDEIQRFVDTWVHLRTSRTEDPGLYHVPFFAGIAQLDSLVTPTSARNGTPNDQQEPFNLDHGDIAKPSSSTHKVYRWVTLKVKQARAIPTVSFDVPSGSHTPDQRLVTSFRARPSRSEWQRAFSDACDTARRDYGFLLVDTSLQREPEACDLDVRVIDSAIAMNILSINELAADCVVQERRRSALGIAVFGSQLSTTVHDLESTLGHLPNRWIDPADSTEELYRHMTNWVVLTIRLKSANAQPNAEPPLSRNVALLENDRLTIFGE